MLPTWISYFSSVSVGFMKLKFATYESLTPSIVLTNLRQMKIYVSYCRLFSRNI